ncbi:MAG: class I SAM-dependent methyltransferase [Pseudomonadota bacterium]
MGHIFDFQDAKIFQDWWDLPENQAALHRENQLMETLLEPVRGRSVLDIGCGTGLGLQFFMELGLSVTGLDPSPYMLDAAAAALGNRADLHRGVAEDLPFDDNSFHYVCLAKTLEFVDNPKAAIAEACRVAKDRVYIGMTNRHAVRKIQRRFKDMPPDSFLNKAHFYSIWEIKDTVYQLLGDVPVVWRSLPDIPMASGKLARRLEQSRLLQRCPFGDYTGMVITPIPRFKTRPLQLPCTANPRPGGVIG